MRPGTAVVAAGSGLAVASLALVADNLRRLAVPPQDPPATLEEVAVLLPVRDEADTVRACLDAVLAAADRCGERVRVLVLDDESSDGTAAVVAAVAELDLRVRLLRGTPTPSGWLGKPWACQQLADHAARGTGVLVFVDADVELLPGALVSSVALLRGSGLDLVCPYPRQAAVGLGERLVQPLLQWSWMSTLPLGLAARPGRPSLSAANGQLLVVDAAAYVRAGGHRAVRGEVLEDIALLRAVKRSGGRGVVTDGSSLARCRMYDGWGQLRAGYAKSLWSAFGSDGGAAGVTALLILAYVVPPVAAVRGSRLGLVGYAAAVLGRALVARRTGGRALPDAFAHPVSVLVLAGLTADSVRGRRRGTLRWRGRPVEVAR